MSARSRSLAGVISGCVIALLLGGCGPNTVTITGRLTKNGEPFKVGEKTQVTFSFGSDDGSKKPALAKLNRADGTFVVEVAPGKYKASLVLTDYEKVIAGQMPTPVIPRSVQKEVYDFTKPTQVTIEIGK